MVGSKEGLLLDQPQSGEHISNVIKSTYFGYTEKEIEVESERECVRERERKRERERESHI